MEYENLTTFVCFLFSFTVPKLSILIPSTGTFSATFFSASNVFAFFAIKVEFWDIRTKSIYGSSKLRDSSSAILLVITEL